jgi:uncharacterized membrane protein
LIDALRGASIVMMFAYHFSFDLNYFGVVRQNFYRDEFWIVARGCILGSFLVLVGISLALATRHGLRWQAYCTRLVQIAACAIVVSIGSYLMFPASWIYFGVLHFIAVASVLGTAFARLAWANLAIGAVLIAIGMSTALPLFDHPWLSWFGLMTHKPVTEDYVPLLPWFGVVLIGMFIGKRIFGDALQSPALQWRAGGPIGRPLAWAGRHSLIIYMVHQPVLIGVLYVLVGHPK